ncbi:MAG: hypothetical protein K2W93_14275 [Burkholderiaceae bacterium]|nr:hypothetical protein [Burkholderiaceae bacterium]
MKRLKSVEPTEDGPRQPLLERPRRGLSLVSALALAGLLGACGGGGSGSAPEPPAPPPTPPAPSTPLSWDQPQATWDNVVWQ